MALPLFGLMLLAACSDVRVFSYSRVVATADDTKTYPDWMRLYLQGDTFYWACMNNYSLDSFEYALGSDSIEIPIGVKSIPDTIYQQSIYGPYVTRNENGVAKISFHLGGVSRDLFTYDFRLQELQRIEYQTSWPGKHQVSGPPFLVQPSAKDVPTQYPHRVAPTFKYCRFLEDSTSTCVVWDRRTALPIDEIKTNPYTHTFERLSLISIVRLRNNPELRLHKEQCIGWPGVKFPWAR